jgi:large subunit ribosomal protein L19
MKSEVIEFNKTQRKDTIDFRAGDIVKVYRKIKEGDKERIQIFEGMIIAIKGKQSSSPMITVRKVSNGFGVEIIVPIFSPTIEKIELVKRAKVRQSKLYYVRDKAAKALRFKFTNASEFIQKEEKQKASTKDAEEVQKEEISTKA